MQTRGNKGAYKLVTFMLILFVIEALLIGYLLWQVPKYKGGEKMGGDYYNSEIERGD